jgi:hypothetical protein
MTTSPEVPQVGAGRAACDFATPDHFAEYVLIDEGAEDAIERLVCVNHLAEMITWRFVNHAEGVCISRVPK